MPTSNLAELDLLPELEIVKFKRVLKHQRVLWLRKKKRPEACPHCAQLSETGYDKRQIVVRDAPIRGIGVKLIIQKRRLWCKSCRKPFTEPIQGIMPKRRTSQRFRKSVAWACQNFADLKKVKTAYRCSNDFIYKALYEHLHIQSRHNNSYPWPKSIGIDEHNFRKVKGGSYSPRQFVTMITDHSNKKLFEVVLGRSHAELHLGLQAKQGRENVRWATIDMCDPYKNFIKQNFPNAQIVADKFHVLRLTNPIINKFRKQITGDKRGNPVRPLLLRNSKNLHYFERSALHKWLAHHDELREVYFYKEALHRLYRTRGYKKAKRAFIKLIDAMAHTTLDEIKKLRRTLMRWKNEILNYFKNPITNARTEGFNNVAKVIKKSGYGFRSFPNYRLRLLNACS